MIRRWFQATAAIIATISDAAERARIAEEFAVLYQRENPRFVRERFLNACHVTTPCHEYQNPVSK